MPSFMQKNLRPEELLKAAQANHSRQAKIAGCKALHEKFMYFVEQELDKAGNTLVNEYNGILVRCNELVDKTTQIANEGQESAYNFRLRVDRVSDKCQKRKLNIFTEAFRGYEPCQKTAPMVKELEDNYNRASHIFSQVKSLNKANYNTLEFKIWFEKEQVVNFFKNNPVAELNLSDELIAKRDSVALLTFPMAFLPEKQKERAQKLLYAEAENMIKSTVIYGKKTDLEIEKKVEFLVNSLSSLYSFYAIVKACEEYLEAKYKEEPCLAVFKERTSIDEFNKEGVVMLSNLDFVIDCLK